MLFWPGHAGHFLGFLISLDKRTYPIHQPNIDVATITSRKDHYTFKNIGWKYGGWRNFHKSFLEDVNLSGTEFKRIDNFLNENYDMYTTVGTPQHFRSYFPALSAKYFDKVSKVNYLLIELSPELQWVIDEFCKNNHNFPNPPGFEFPQDFHDCFNNYKKNNNPYIINLDNVLYGKDTFVEEYTKLNQHLGLPLHLDDAIEFYSDWYKARKMHNLPISKPR